MTKQITKIILNGKSLGTKPLMLEDTLTIVREKLKERINIAYIFLDKNDNDIKNEDENNLKLQDISTEKAIKIKEDLSLISVFLDDSKICFLKYIPSQKLDETRKILLDKIKVDFDFLDPEFDISNIDEPDYEIQDILKDRALKLKTKNNTFIKLNETTKNNIKSNINKRKIQFDFSQYEIIEKKEGLTQYKYSSIPRKQTYNLVYQYFYDQYEPKDFHDAYVVLFCGKTGDGKTTAINAFFNIIKGIILEDDFRFILINEPEKEKGQAESQTDGVHIYYLRDYNNEPVILIDSQGYGDTRGKEYDEMVDKAFQYVFSHVIDHINTVGFIVKSNTNRIDILTKYIFSSVTSLFSEDISENFIILATFANKSTMEKGPDFVSSIKTDADFLKIEERMDPKWWYAFDSKNILDNEQDKLTIYSFSKASELYEEKVKKLRKKGIKTSSEVLNTRMELKIQVANLTDEFHKLIIEQGNLLNKQEIIDDNGKKIEKMESKINELQQDMKQLNPKELEQKVFNLNNEFNKMMNYLDNQTVYQTINILRESTNLCTHCNSCQKNCHVNCDCFLSSIGRCKIFTFWKRRCEECGCDKNKHKQDYYSYNYETLTTKKNTDKEKENERNKKIEEEKKIKEEIKRKKDVKAELVRQKKNLENNKLLLLGEKENNIKEKIEIQKKINEINQRIFITILKLQNLTERINDIAMNNNHLKNEDEYIDDLMDKMDKMNIRDKEKIKKIKNIKENNRIIREALNLDKNTLANMSYSQLVDRLRIRIPN